MNLGQHHRIRKGLNQLSEAEKKQYFFLMRCMLIFTPKSQDRFPLKYSYGDYPANLGPETVYPKCLYDTLVAFHADSCEHMSEFFPYWHRWLMSRFEHLLLEASKYVLDSNYLAQESKRIYQIIPADRQKLTNPNQILALLTQMKKDYEQIGSKLGAQASKTIACHYWEFFNDDKNTNYPDGFISREKYYCDVFKAADELIKIMWDQDSIYEINLATRFDYIPAEEIVEKSMSRAMYEQDSNLINNTEFWNYPEGLPDLIKKAKQILTKIQVDGIPTTEALQYFKFRQFELRQLSSRVTPDEIVVRLNPKKFRLNVFSQKEVTFFFGGGDYPYYNIYRQPPSPDPIYQFKDLRNQSVGFLTYARSLLTHPLDFIIKYCTKRNESVNFSMETPHNFLHNNQQYTMNDGSFSIINPIFMAYHGTIDLMLEYKIHTFTLPERLIAGIGVLKFLETPINFTIEVQNFRRKWAEYFKKTTGRIAKYGDYPITKYIDPLWNPQKLPEADPITEKSFQPVTQFNYHHIILTNTRSLKTLEQFSGSIYQNIERSQFATVVKRTVAPTPYSPTNRYVAYEITVPPEVHNQNIYVEFADSSGVIATKLIPIFKRPGNCPNCKKDQGIIIAFPVEDLGAKYTELLATEKDGQKINELFRSGISVKVLYPNAHARIVLGRKSVRLVNLVNANSNEQVPNEIISDVKFKVQESNHRPNLSTRCDNLVQQPATLTYNPLKSRFQKLITFEQGQYNITELMGASKIRRDNIDDLVFPLFAWETEVELGRENYAGGSGWTKAVAKEIIPERIAEETQPPLVLKKNNLHL